MPSHSGVFLVDAPFALLKAASIAGKGRGKLSGTVKVDSDPDFPTLARVVLIREQGNMMVDEQWTDPDTGEYEFIGLDQAQKYTVLAYDPDGLFRAVVGNDLSPNGTVY